MKLRFVTLMILLIVPISNIHYLWGYNIIKTPYFILFYPAKYENEAVLSLNSLEYYRRYTENLTGYKRKRTPILLEDAGMIINGYANPVFDRISLFTYPPSTGELQNMENWFTGVSVHEYTHILQMQNSSGLPGLLAKILGNFMSPNMLCPYWMIEGIAVYSESNYSEYSGRLNDSYYQYYGYISSVRDNFPGITEATYYPNKYPGGTSYYLYGGLFTEYLAINYGDDKISEFFYQNGRSVLSYLSPLFPYFGIDRTAKRVFGKRMPKLWEDFRIYQADKSYSKYTDSKHKRLTDFGWRIRNLTIHEDKLYFERSYPVKTSPFGLFYFNEIIRFDPVADIHETILATTSSFNHPLKFDKEKIYYLVEDFNKGFRNQTYMSFGIVSLLYEYDTSENKKTLILKDRIRAFDVLENGDILFSRDSRTGFGSEICIFSRTGKSLDLIFYDELLIDSIISDSDSGIIIFTARKDFSNFGIYSFDIDKRELAEIINLPSIERDPFLINNKLLFTSTYDKIPVCSVYEFETEKFYKVLNSTYAITPVLDEREETLYFIGLNPEGNDIYSQSFATEPFSFDPPDHEFFIPESTEFEKGNYLDNLRTLYPKIRIPYFYFSDDDEFAGLYLAGQDAIGHFDYEIDILYDFLEKEFENRFFLGTKLLSPIYLRFGYEEDNNGTFSSTIQYPLLNRFTPGLSRLYFGIYGELYNKNKRKEILPFIYFGFQYPYGSINTYHFYIIESKSLDSQFSRNGFINQLYARQYVKNSQVSLRFLNIYDKDYLGYYSYSMRGYSDKIKSNDLNAAKADFSLPIIKIRKGLWNPNIFFEDIILNLFFDYADSKGDIYQSGGLELHLETHALFNFSFDCYVRASINKDNEKLISIGIVSADLFGIFSRWFDKIQP